MSDLTTYGGISVQGLTLEKLLRVLSNADWVPTAMSCSGTLTVDTINEKTGAAGVTVETVLLKDGYVVVTGGQGMRCAVATSNIEFAGGDGLNSGGNLRVYGQTHDTQANDIELRSGSNVKLQWDDSAGDWLLTGDLDISGTLTVDTINEHTTDAGITLDGVLIKDNSIDIGNAAASFCVGCNSTTDSVVADPTSDNPAAWLEFKVDGSSRYIPVYTLSGS